MSFLRECKLSYVQLYKFIFAFSLLPKFAWLRNNSGTKFGLLLVTNLMNGFAVSESNGSHVL
jgi:hypothetical protein